MQSVKLSRADIANLVPHRGTMCLLGGVESWAQTHIICAATSHRDPSHPLRDDKGLRAVCGIEYAAQAIAVHRGLLGAERNRKVVGVIGGVRDVILAVERLDDISAALTFRADTLVEQSGSLMYRFTVHAGEQLLLSGRVSVTMLNATAGSPHATRVTQASQP